VSSLRLSALGVKTLIAWNTAKAIAAAVRAMPRNADDST